MGIFYLGSQDVESSAKGAQGRSGGLAILWKVGTLSASSVLHVGYMGIQLEWHGELYFIIKLYSTCDL